MVSAFGNVPGSPKGLSEETFDSFLSRENLNLPSPQLHSLKSPEGCLGRAASLVLF